MLSLLILFGSCDPFGIDPNLSAAYRSAINQANNSFTCLDQSQVIPLSALNDGKCDCPDGSDEPGTSACLNGHFYCHNAGGKPKRIPSHKVNDGICDCCDGSDEFDNPNAQCPNICADLVAQSSSSRESIYHKINAGIRRRKESLRETQSDFPQAQREMRELRQDLAKFEHELDILNRKKREARKLWKMEKRQMKGITDEQHAEMKRRKHEYIHKPPKKKEEEKLDEPDIHGFQVPYDEDLGSIDWNVDEGVEELIFHATPRPPPVRRRDAYASRDHAPSGDSRIYKRTHKWKELRKKEKERAASSQEALGFIGKARGKVKDIVDKVFGSDQPPSKKQYDEVEKEISDLNSAMSDVRTAIYRMERKMGHDLGPDNIWWPLSEQVFELSKDGNDYQLTFLRHLMQRQTGSLWYGTCYGTFTNFNETGRVMYYENGQMCWEGPPRRTELYLYCGPSNKLLDVEEVDRCGFRGHFETPLCCSDDYIDYVKQMSDVDLSEFIAQWEKVE